MEKVNGGEMDGKANVWKGQRGPMRISVISSFIGIDGECLGHSNFNGTLLISF